MTPDEIRKLITDHLPDSEVVVNSDDNTHFETIVVCPSFAGKRAVQRHQMIYSALGTRMGGDIHALSIQALTPEEAGGD
jgi:acid stress-induced BolA-like protein IbaG/YrbA